MLANGLDTFGLFISISSKQEKALYLVIIFDIQKLPNFIWLTSYCLMSFEIQFLICYNYFSSVPRN